jgi:hypothetical protein
MSIYQIERIKFTDSHVQYPDTNSRHSIHYILNFLEEKDGGNSTK